MGTDAVERPQPVDRVALMNAMMATMHRYHRLKNQLQQADDKAQWVVRRGLEFAAALNDYLAAWDAYINS